MKRPHSLLSNATSRPYGTAGLMSVVPFGEPQGRAVQVDPWLNRVDPGLNRVDPGLNRVDPGLNRVDPGLNRVQVK